jgi:hypothetical protein
MSYVLLPCLAGYLIFHHIKVSQVKNLITPLRRAHRDDRNGYIICSIWSSREKVPDGYDSEDLRRFQNHHQARVLGTNITIFIALVNCEFRDKNRISREGVGVKKPNQTKSRFRENWREGSRGHEKTQGRSGSPEADKWA